MSRVLSTYYYSAYLAEHQSEYKIGTKFHYTEEKETASVSDQTD